MRFTDDSRSMVGVPDNVKRMWNEWTIRGFILFSIALQITLILLGNVRKYYPRTRVRSAMWFAYVQAFAIATAGLGAIMGTSLKVSVASASDSSVPKQNTSELMCFWASFLLIHLGGPDVVSAIALQDNELYLKHFLEILFQLGIAVYILLSSWPGLSDLPQLSVLVFVAGSIKCFERVKALQLANVDNFRDSILGLDDKRINYPKFLEDLHVKKSQGFSANAEVEDVAEPLLSAKDPQRHSNAISEAYHLLQAFKRLFMNLVLTFEDKVSSQSYFRHLKSGDAFRIIEIELAFVYDMLYTKANVVYTHRGLLLRLTCFCCLFLLPGGFYFLCNANDYLFIDIFITYTLLGSAILMEIDAIITMLRSDWTDLWLRQQKLTRDILIFSFLKRPSKRRWSNCIAQLDLLSVAVDEKPPRFLQIQKLFGISNMLVKHRYTSYSKVSNNLKDLIYSQFCESMVFNSHRKALCSDKGITSLRKNKCESLTWTITSVEFDQSILIWHIATTLCYYSDLDNQDDAGIYASRTESKHISDYLLHLYVSYPDILPLGIGMIRYRDTCAEATRFFKEKAPNASKVEACKMLLQVDCVAVFSSKLKGSRSKSVLSDACMLALSLKIMDKERMWEVTSQVWIEILAYAATHCRTFYHGQQLGQGGEFLTHVWLLMAHLGLAESTGIYQSSAHT